MGEIGMGKESFPYRCNERHLKYIKRVEFIQDQHSHRISLKINSYDKVEVM